MSSINQLSFTSGELSQSIWGRTVVLRTDQAVALLRRLSMRIKSVV